MGAAIIVLAAITVALAAVLLALLFERRGPRR